MNMFMSAEKYQCAQRCGGVRHSNMHYIPIHTNLCINMRKLEMEHLRIDVNIEHSELCVLSLKNTGKPTCDFEFDLF